MRHPRAIMQGEGAGARVREEVFVFDSKSENKDRAVEAVESVSEARAGVRVRVRHPRDIMLRWWT